MRQTRSAAAWMLVGATLLAGGPAEAQDERDVPLRERVLRRLGRWPPGDMPAESAPSRPPRRPPASPRPPTGLEPSGPREAAHAWLRRIGFDIQLEELARLRSLDLTRVRGTARSHLTVDSLRHLRALPRLRELRLPTTAEDSWLQVLPDLNGLEVLVLAGSGVSDTGLATLRRCHQLTELDLSRTRITDFGLQDLTVLTSLRELRLESTRIGDQALRILSRMRRLRVLDLANTDVTDRGLEQLEEIPDLFEVNLRRTRVSRTAIEDLEDAIPQLRVLGP